MMMMPLTVMLALPMAVMMALVLTVMMALPSASLLLYVLSFLTYVCRIDVLLH